MEQRADHKTPHWLIHLDSVDSTNNYATHRIEAGLAQNGECIIADRQTAGKGQRNNLWQNDANNNIAMSLIVSTGLHPHRYPLLCMMTANVLLSYFSRIYNSWQPAIKWPNDIYINDKKASGVLIENVWKGMEWKHAVIGIGINVNQYRFPENLPNATSLRIESGLCFKIPEIISDVRAGILNGIKTLETKPAAIINDYNEHLYKRQCEVYFEERINGRRFHAFVQEVDADGRLLLLSSKGIERFDFGSISWIQA